MINKINLKLQRMLIDFLDDKISLKGRNVCFTFDDVPKSAIDFILSEIPHVPTTLFISGGLCNTSVNGIEICSVHDLNKIDWGFHELASHSYLHLDFQQNKLSDLVEDLQKNATFLNQFSKNRSYGFAFPKGRYNYRGYKSMLKAKTKYARVTQVGANINTVNKYSIKSIPLYENLYTLESIKNIIEKYRDIENLLLVFYTHDVTDNFERFGCSKNYFKSVLKIVNKSNFKISTISNALNLD